MRLQEEFQRHSYANPAIEPRPSECASAVATGHFAEKFRPHNTFHKEISGFDYQNGVYYYNVGEGAHRNWDDYVKFNCISAGQGAKWSNSIQ
jgi:hypothetical protein